MPAGQQTSTPMQGLGELSQSDLTSLVGGLPGTEHEEDTQIADTDDIFKQLGDTAFELEHLFNDFNAAQEIKVHLNVIICISGRQTTCLFKYHNL